jgi:hypothetical protein
MTEYGENGRKKNATSKIKEENINNWGENRGKKGRNKDWTRSKKRNKENP